MILLSSSESLAEEAEEESIKERTEGTQKSFKIFIHQGELYFREMVHCVVCTGLGFNYRGENGKPKEVLLYFNKKKHPDL